MKDIFDAQIVCSKCNTKTNKNTVEKDGFILRYSECPKCKEKYFHPTDIKQFEDFKKLREREFRVKLRMVGNSFSVTIPREIIAFEEKFLQMEKEMDNMMRLCLDRPGRLSLEFRKLRR